MRTNTCVYCAVILKTLVYTCHEERSYFPARVQIREGERDLKDKRVTASRKKHSEKFSVY